MGMMFRKKSQVIISLLALFLFASCEAKDTNIIKAQDAAQKFHSRFNTVNFKEIYEDSDPSFRATISESSFIDKMKKLRETHGEIRESILIEYEHRSWWERRFANNNPTHLIGYSNKCDKDGFPEIFLWNVTGNEAKLIKYENGVIQLKAK